MLAELSAIFIAVSSPIVTSETCSVQDATMILALNIYHEARDQDPDGMKMVAEVTLNRSMEWNKSLCEVVFAENQFSWTDDGLSDTPKDGAAFLESLLLSVEIMNGEADLLGTEALYYVNHDKLNFVPSWIQNVKLLGKVGDHTFYGDK